MTKILKQFNFLKNSFSKFRHSFQLSGLFNVFPNLLNSAALSTYNDQYLCVAAKFTEILVASGAATLDSDRERVARWFVFKPRISIWVNFGGP
jgi:hypothetical protein